MKAFLLMVLTFSVSAADVKFVKKLQAGKAQKIVVYGTSLTAKGPWAPVFQKMLQEKFGENASLINSGGSGKDSNWGLAHLEKKVLAHEPDVVFIEFGMNDAVTRFKNTKETVEHNVELMITRIQKSLPNCEIILTTMNPAFHPVGHRSHRTDLNAYYDIYREAAETHNLVLIDHFKNWQDFLKNKNYKLYIPDSVHPNKLGSDKVIVPALMKLSKT
ncbi:MAG: SGNH/GDSL hydrolase family protein [Lentisphaeraceae bacterium]|nr:SGNH/GDSL hydrolase family protein [Lentisphaeraceae bacterium]